MTKTSSRLLSLVLGIVMVVGIFAVSLARIPNGVSAAQPTFTDVPTTFWAYSYIEKAAADGAVNGVGDNKFNPNGTLTVAQWMVIVTRAFCGDRVDASTATSVWYSKNKDVADQLGLLDGVSNTNMNSAINRYDMAQIVHNVLYAAGCEVMEATGNYSIAVMPDRVADWSSIPAKYQVAVGTVFDNGIIMGTDDKGTFNGSGTFTRAQAAAVYTRMANFMEWDAGMMFPSKLELDASQSQPAEPEDTEEVVTAPVENTSSGDTTFAMKNGENVQQMMDRINAATPAYQEGYLTNGKKITDANIQEMLDEMKVSMPAGSAWKSGSNQTYHYYSPSFGGGYACYSFAAAASDKIFGEDAPLMTHQNYDNIKIGDVIWLCNTYRTGSNGHLYVVMSNPDKDGYFDAFSGNVSEKVSWSGGSNIVRLKANTEYSANSIIYSRY